MFVCPSVNDAGPMMVKQSLCCGTPVVGFDMGAVKQVVKDRGTGICVPIRDSKALAEGMYNIILMSAKEYQQMSYKAREVALKTSSYEAQADRIISIYKKYRD
jgi:glycosyltransferase involved in cell wall biosynthesis